MKGKFNEKRAISKITLSVLAALLMAGMFYSCEKDELIEQEEPVAIALKSGTTAVHYPDVFAGPVTFSPLKGKVVKQTITLENQNYGDYETTFALVVKNGDDNGLNMVAGANIYVNGLQVFTMADFKKAPAIMYREINNLGASTTIEVEVKGKTTDVLNLWVEGILVPTFTDERDGHVYKMVTIGTQTWMAENLAFQTEYGSYAYDDVESNIAIFGRLYTWDAAMGACPAGWHMPSNAEWNTLLSYLTDNGYGYEDEVNAIAKALASTTGWVECSNVKTPGWEPESNNSSGFTALPGGSRSYMGFSQLSGYYGYWWSSDQKDTYSSYCRVMTNSSPTTYQDGLSKSFGFSVRCIKDAE